MATKLSNRGINGLKCLKCCQMQRDLSDLRLRGLLGEMLRRVIDLGPDDVSDPVLALRYPTGPTVFPPPPPKVIIAPRGSPLLIGTVILLGALALGNLIRRLATREVLTALIEQIDKLTQDDCERCIRKGLWGQKKPRVAGVFFARRNTIAPNLRQKEYRRFPTRYRKRKPELQ